MVNENERTLNILGRLLACEALIMGMLSKREDHQKICLKAAEMVEKYDREARTILRCGDEPDLDSFAFAVFGEARAAIVATACVRRPAENGKS